MFLPKILFKIILNTTSLDLEAGKNSVQDLFKTENLPLDSKLA